MMEEKTQEGQQDTSSLWSTKRIQDLLRRVDEEGLDFKSIDNPFDDNDPELKRANIVWEYTKEEILEMKKCAEDVTYFSKYCKVMTDSGLDYIKLRDYQESVLREYQNNRFNIFLAPRQVGKCVLPTTYITTKSGKKVKIKDLNPNKNTGGFLCKLKNFLYGLYSTI